jgi:hypothetical protein
MDLQWGILLPLKNLKKEDPVGTIYDEDEVESE